MRIHSETTKVHPKVWMFSSADATISLHKFNLFSLGFPYKHILIMSDGDSELDKYRSPIMRVTYNV